MPEIRLEAEPCSELKYPEDFDRELIAQFVDAAKAHRNMEDEHDVEDVLELMQLGRRDGSRFVPNTACVLTFANDPRRVVPGCRIRFLRFETDAVGEKWNPVRDDWIEGSVPLLIDGAADAIRSQLRTFSRVGPGGRFFTSKEYPESAWYEALVNACAHRSYGNGLKNTPITVRMFHSKLEIESPGAFPPFVTKENIYDMHIARNPFLMGAMYYFQFVKMAHEGTRRMKRLMLEHDLPEPEFVQDEVSHAMVRVTLRNNIRSRRQWVDADVVELLGAQVAHSLSPEEKRCINFAAENGQINVSDAVRLVGGDWRTNKRRLDRLLEKGIMLRTHGSGRDRDPKQAYILNSPDGPPTTG